VLSVLRLENGTGIIKITFLLDTSTTKTKTKLLIDMKDCNISFKTNQCTYLIFHRDYYHIIIMTKQTFTTIEKLNGTLSFCQL